MKLGRCKSAASNRGDASSRFFGEIVVFWGVDSVLPQLNIIQSDIALGWCSKECFPSLSAEPNWTQLQDNNWKWKLSALLVQLHSRLHYHIISQSWLNALIANNYFSPLSFWFDSRKKQTISMALSFQLPVWMGFYSFSCFKDPIEPIYYEPNCVYEETVCKYLVHLGFFRHANWLFIYLLGVFSFDVHAANVCHVERKTRLDLQSSHFDAYVPQTLSLKIQIQRSNYHVRHFIRVFEWEKKKCYMQAKWFFFFISISQSIQKRINIISQWRRFETIVLLVSIVIMMILCYWSFTLKLTNDTVYFLFSNHRLLFVG